MPWTSKWEEIKNPTQHHAKDSNPPTMNYPLQTGNSDPTCQLDGCGKANLTQDWIVYELSAASFT